jgi:ABC-type lipoprotein export system ATPase subunit
MPRPGRSTARTAAVRAQFGLPPREVRRTVIEPTTVPLGTGKIVLFAGPSGSGKSSALACIDRRFAGACNTDRISFPAGAAIIDRIAPGAPLGEAVSILTSCGLGEARLWLRRFDDLSDGERFRAKLARAVALQVRAGSTAPLICDEFCSMLHRRAARAISYNLRKTVSRRNLSVVLASSHEDVIADLQPDTIVRLAADGRTQVERRPPPRKRPVSFRRRLRIERGSKRDYQAFAAMHYRTTDELGFVDRVFVLRDGLGGDLLGIVVYAHAPLGLSLRNKATGGMFDRRPKRLNRRLRTLRRLVIRPDVRGCGLGHYLVQRTMPMVGTDYVECLASMGEFNPVFEKAGMRRIGQYDVPAKCRKALEALGLLDVNPYAHEFVMQVCRRRRVRAIVADVVRDWYARTTAGGDGRVERQSPQLLAQTFRAVIGSRPVYYLWRKHGAA